MKSNAAHLILGQKAEEYACVYLIKQGLKLREKNFRCRLGEIDLIMQDTLYLIFVEVRCRQNPNYGRSAETIDFRKQQRLINAANYYLQIRQLYEKFPCRFDVIAVDKSNQADKINWIQNAFTM